MTKDAGIARWMAIGSYPTVMATALGLFAALAAAGLQVVLAAYLAVLIGAAFVTLHEALLPHRATWRPAWADVYADLLFMATVQVALPYLLSISLALALAAWLRTAGLAIDDLWPHRWPVAAQACLMLLLADLARYWLHRAFHKSPPCGAFTPCTIRHSACIG